MKLTANFTLAELTASAKARELGIDNTPPDSLLSNLQRLANMLQAVRDNLGVPVTVTSGYRNEAVNKAVGGATSSDHKRGDAADIVAPGYGTPYQVAKALAPLVSTLGIGQLIYERTARSSWVHVSTVMPAKPSNRVITFNGSGYELGIQES